MKKIERVCLWILGIIGMLGVIMSATYAFWKYSTEQSQTNVAGTECLSISLVDESEAITVEKAYPLTDEAGMNSKPYTFTVKNNCDSLIDYSVRLESLDIANKMGSENIAVSIDGETKQVLSNLLVVPPTYEGKEYKAIESHILLNGFLDGHEEQGHMLRLWIDESAGNEAQNKTFLSKVVVEGTLNEVLAGTPNVTISNKDINNKEIANIADVKNFPYSSSANLICEGEKSVCYIKASEEVTIEGSILQTCGTKEEPENCVDVPKEFMISPDTWYKTKTDLKITPTENQTSTIDLTTMVCVGYDCSEKEKYTLLKQDVTPPQVKVNSIEVNLSQVVIDLTTNDSESGVSNVTCKYGLRETDLNLNGTMSNNQCILTDFISNTEYYYAIEATDKVGNVAKETGKITTDEILTAPTITGGSLLYASSRTISVSIPGTADSGVKEYEYYISKTNEIPSSDVVVSGTTDNQTVINSDLEGPNYIFYRTVSNRGNKSSWSGAQQVNIYYKASSVTYSITEEPSVTNVQEAIDVIRKKLGGV